MNAVYKKILFVNPGTDSMFSSNEPLNLALLASFLRKQGIEVEIADKLSGEDIIKKYRRFCPDIVGITATTTMVSDAYKVAKNFREKKVPVVIGGVHATTLPHEVLKNADMVVTGEGELALLNIMENGITSGIVTSEELIDINATPLPARDLLNNDYYLNVRKKFPQDGNFLFVPYNEKLLSVMISRGCPWNCAFCHNVWRNKPFRIYKPEKVLEELERLKRDYNLKYFVFRDDNIYSNKKKVRSILETIIDSKLNLHWGANARADCLDEEMVELSRNAGCLKLNFGFESGSQRMLDDLNKRVKVEKVFETVALCKKVGLQVSGSFIVGHPNETKNDVNATIRVIRKLKLDSIGVAIATPFPGTDWWRIAEERKMIPKDIHWGQFDFDHIPILLNKSHTKRKLKGIQRKYYMQQVIANPKYLISILKTIIYRPLTFIRRILNITGVS